MLADFSLPCYPRPRPPRLSCPLMSCFSLFSSSFSLACLPVLLRAFLCWCAVCFSSVRHRSLRPSVRSSFVRLLSFFPSFHPFVRLRLCPPFRPSPCPCFCALVGLYVRLPVGVSSPSFRRSFFFSVCPFVPFPSVFPPIRRPVGVSVVLFVCLAVVWFRRCVRPPF